MSSILKNIGILIIWMVLIAMVLYGAAILFIGVVSWVWGIEPQHLLPGMSPYSEWKLK